MGVGICCGPLLPSATQAHTHHHTPAPTSRHPLPCLPPCLTCLPPPPPPPPAPPPCQVLDTDFFLVAAKDAFMEAARQFLFENYCRIHQVGARGPGGGEMGRRWGWHGVWAAAGGAAGGSPAWHGSACVGPSVCVGCVPWSGAHPSRRCCGCAPPNTPPPQAISIKSLSEKLNMDEEATEKWIVNLIRCGSSASRWHSCAVLPCWQLLRWQDLAGAEHPRDPASLLALLAHPYRPPGAGMRGSMRRLTARRGRW